MPQSQDPSFDPARPFVLYDSEAESSDGFRPRGRARRVFMVVGEESGDQLGARLIAALKRRNGEGAYVFQGIGGERMAREGVASLFPLSDIAVNGFTAVIGRLRLILRRIRQAADAAIAANPDVVVIIDSPDFTHRVAKIIRQKRPEIPIIDYVSPSVWAWRPGRAKKMTAYVDHLLAILPFEPQVHRELSGPPCTYVGHPLVERWKEILQAEGMAGRVISTSHLPLLLVLPGSRSSEVRRLLEPFGETVGVLAAQGLQFEVAIPAVPHLVHEIRKTVSTWAVKPRVIVGEAKKFAEFGRATVALAASGTVTLELALFGVPMVVAYKLDAVYRQVNRLRRIFPKLIRVSSMVLVNIIVGRNAIPEFLDDNVTPMKLAAALRPLFVASEERDRQLDAFAELDDRMRLPDGRAPSDKAAEVVEHYAGA